MLKANCHIAKTYHADPEARIYGGKYYIYATKSRAYSQQKNIDLYVSSDGEHWTEHKNIIDMSTFPYVTRAVWAPSVVEKDGLYYLIFACNDIQSDAEDGGLEIAVAPTPEGPFKNHIGTHLIDKFINGAQPIKFFQRIKKLRAAPGIMATSRIRMGSITACITADRSARKASTPAY
ncbi:MAG: family 43 glycosylhydrolase [Eubacterium sp.]|nr:family 43 glycosylhydrolase [Eubacterium sp.]